VTEGITLAFHMCHCVVKFGVYSERCCIILFELADGLVLLKCYLRLQGWSRLKMRGRSPLRHESAAPTVWLMHAATGRCHRL